MTSLSRMRQLSIVLLLIVLAVLSMPPTTKRKKMLSLSLKKARRTKKFKATIADRQEREPQDLSDLLNLSHDALNTSNECVDPDFDPESSMKSDSSFTTDKFCEEWLEQLSWEDKTSLGLFLSFQLLSLLNVSKYRAAELAGILVGKSVNAIITWQDAFFENGGTVVDHKQGHYQRSGVLWNCESLSRKATQHIRENASVKGSSNLTSHSFCEWVNEELLPNETLEPGFPRKISVETARKWMHEMGFEVQAAKKGSYVDGHERDDVVEYRKKFLRRMAALGFLNQSNAPTEEAKAALPMDLESPSSDTIDKTVIFFHDESTFQSNDDQSTFWGEKGTTVMRPKNKGAGIMVSDFIDEKNGYLRFTQEEYDLAKQSDPNIWMEARAFLEYGENREGYWNSEKFMNQIKMAVKIAEAKYPKCDNWRHVWIFDHSSCHSAMPDDALDVSKMNVNPGGKQRIMRDGFWDGKVQRMNYAIGIPKGLRVILEERGINTQGMNGNQMREILGEHEDFKNEKSLIERFLVEEKKHIVYFLPKFHPELNPIERVWAQSKKYARAHCKYSLPSLRRTIGPALDSVSPESIRKHFNKVRHYMFAYLEGLPGGLDLEKQVKRYKKAVKSHRRISDVQ